MQENTTHSLEKNIIFEDEDILVLNKPAYIVVNDAQTVGEVQTVQSWLETYLKNTKPTKNWQVLIPEDFNSEFGTPEEIFTQRNGIVHRIDKETSGVLILAKNPGSLFNLLSQFKERSVEKEYLCLAHGKLRFTQDTINAPIGRASKDRKKFTTTIEGRPSVTEYAVQEFFPHFNETKWLELFKNNALDKINYHYQGNYKNYFKIYQGFSLVKCRPKTGRTHQIRVHMAHIQHPLVGDATYAGEKRKRADALWCARQFLHAQKLEIMHPRTKERVTFEAQLPRDLTQALTLLSSS